jgi:hypothetical protein
VNEELIAIPGSSDTTIFVNELLAGLGQVWIDTMVVPAAMVIVRGEDVSDMGEGPEVHLVLNPGQLMMLWSHIRALAELAVEDGFVDQELWEAANE